MLRDARRRGPRGLVLACLGVAACTGKDPPAQEPPAAVEHVVPALPPEESTEPARAAAAPIAPSLATIEAPRPTPRCSLAAPKGAPEQALAAVIAELPVEPSFGCPATYRLIQRQGPYHTYAGTDAATGDRVWITLLHDSRLKERALVGYRPQEYGARCDVRGPMPAGWFCVRASARTHAGATPLQAWLTAHPDVDAVDWVSFELNPDEEPDWRALPRVFHLHVDRATTLCWQRGADRRCWQRADVARSRIGEGGLHTEVGIVTTAGGQDTTWTLSADGALTGETDAGVWPEIDPTPSELIGLYPHSTIQTRADGVVALGRYDQVGGGGGVSLDTFVEWLVVRRSDGWTAVPVPDTIVRAVVLAGQSLAIVASTFLIGDGPVIERRDLLTFITGARGPEFVGALPSEVGVTEMSDGGDYTWSHAIRARGPNCVQLAAGEASGRIFGHQRDGAWVERAIRPPFRKLAGDWRITPQGPRRGCPRA